MPSIFWITTSQLRFKDTRDEADEEFDFFEGLLLLERGVENDQSDGESLWLWF
ncbi:hypothetical protein BY996DRAFT_6476637 [Phakopsora pachyrhizi]|uniref:Uncharacterized protein n=1 Tax=Phakopsora pachyrhizi TaxID=170000 RepID=A0AAV0AMQ9_PHAPC|nr:hypothetical protein BY996DRAFT_6476637 [Phakopsora pachyrhizi]CAH7668867.1 hypothetical protein PPACK8108_LOCUS3431 [Phakopsora pachyrhizi]